MARLRRSSEWKKENAAVIATTTFQRQEASKQVRRSICVKDTSKHLANHQ